MQEGTFISENHSLSWKVYRLQNGDTTDAVISVFHNMKVAVEMNFYKINKDYIRYAHLIDQNCIESFQSVGVILRLNGYIYFLPVDGADKSDYNINGKLKRLPRLF